MGTVEWILLAIVGFGAGIGLGFWLSRYLRGDDREKLADTEAEFAAYKAEVSQHFSQSAAHFQAIGKQYRELYAHMAVGSEKLCEIADTDGPLQFPRPDEVILAKEAAGLSGIAAAGAASGDVPGEEASAQGADAKAGAGETSSRPESAVRDSKDAELPTETMNAQDSMDDGESSVMAEPIEASKAEEADDSPNAGAHTSAADKGDTNPADDAEQILEANQPVDYVKDEPSATQTATSEASDSDDSDEASAVAKTVEVDDVDSTLAESADEPNTRLYH